MNLFIDTNIYLKFYHFTSDELEELQKLIILIEEQKLKLFLPKQVIQEYKRNREVKIADALKKMSEEKLNNTFPVFCKEYREYGELQKTITKYKELKNKLTKDLKVAIDSNSLKADRVIENLFNKAFIVDFEEEVISKAKLRFDLGNPPGKNNSYGDAISWESLILKVPDGEDLYFLSDDKDYFSIIDNSKFNNYLFDEWKIHKSSKIVFYKSLSDFFKSNYPDIKLATELYKDIMIKNLEESGNFAMARKNLHKLDAVDNFNSDQINRIIKIAYTNSQLFWIGDDSDINEILFRFERDYNHVLTEENILEFNKKYNEKKEDDLPF